MIGKLSFVNNKWRIVFFNEKKGKDATLFCNESDFASGFSPSREAETEVEFERDSTPQQNPIKIRPKGQEWIARTAEQTTATAQAQTGQRRSHGGMTGDRARHQRQQRRRNQNQSDRPTNLPREFHNPYNFVPAVPRDVNDAELGDKKPVGHDKFHTGFYSGKLTIKMTVKTPLLAIDTAKVEVDGEHKKYPVRIENGKPFINPTAVKGMLRSAYEAVTNSRFGVLDKKHKDRLAFRPEVGQGASVVPVRIEEENDRKKIVFYTGTNEAKDLNEDGTPNQGKPLCAAWLPRYLQGNIDINAPTYSDSTLPKHEDKVKCWVEKFEHWRWDRRINTHRQDFILWRVREIVKETKNLDEQPSFSTDTGKQNRRSYYKPLDEMIQVEGFVFISNHNMQRKHDERVFFKNPNSPGPEILAAEKWKDLQKAWKELIENYLSEHEIVKGRLEPVPASLGIAEWSRHIQQAAIEKELKPGMLCYAEVEKDEAGNFIVKRLFPVMISRQLYECSPLALLDESLRPAESLEKLSPADRVFGWVNQKGSGAYRGQLRIGLITTERTDAIQNFNDLPLNILGQPKPQQGRFYVARNQNGDAQPDGLKNEEAGYSENTEYPTHLLQNGQKERKGLRGRKVYPHHAHIEDDNFWFENSDFDENSDHWQKDFTNSKGKKYFREYLRPRKDDQQQRDSQNRSIKGWVKPGTEFQFDIHFTNLSKVELGALVWLLNLPENHFHRLGGGKPYGFGSVRLEIVSEEITSGEDLKEFYQSLDSNLKNSIAAAECKTAFESVANQEILNAFKVACKGFDDRLPIHYPRTTKELNPEGKSYEWFVENNRLQRGQVVNGYVLPNLTDDRGLPILRRQR